jgi:uncharacterized protein
MADLQLTTPTPDERVIAALAHISVLLPMMGVIAPLVIWVTQKDKSRYVAFQSLQSLVYQLVMIAAWFLGMGCYMFSFFGTFLAIPLASRGSHTLSPLFAVPFFIPFVVIGLLFMGNLCFIAYGVVGAGITVQGRPFRYVIIGKRLEHFMETKPSAVGEQ